MPTEELEKYFFSSLVELTFSPVSKHLEAVHEHLSRTFPTDPTISAQLHKSLLKVAKLIDASIATEVKEVCQQLAVKLETLAFSQKVYVERRSSSLRDLNSC